MVHGERKMTGFVWVEADAIEDDDVLREWVELAERWVSAMERCCPSMAAGWRGDPPRNDGCIFKVLSAARLKKRAARSHRAAVIEVVLPFLPACVSKRT